MPDVFRASVESVTGFVKPVASCRRSSEARPKILISPCLQGISLVIHPRGKQSTYLATILSPMRIAFVMRSFYSKRIAALSRTVLELAVRMQRDGHQVVIITDGDTEKEEQVYGLTVRQCQTNGLIRTFRDLLDRAQVDNDLIYFHCSLLGAVLSRSAIKNVKTRLWIHLYTAKASFEDLEQIRFDEYFKLYKRLFTRNYFFSLFVPRTFIRRTLQQVEGLVVPSKRLKQFYERWMEPEKISVLIPGCDNEVYQQDDAGDELLRTELAAWSEGKQVILHAGLASPLRGVEDVLRVFTMLRQREERFVLLLMLYTDDGEGIGEEMLLAVRQTVSELPPNSVKLITEPVKNVFDLFSVADVALYRYRYTGDIPECPLTLLELMGKGVPVITNEIGALSEYVPEEGLLKTWDDSTAAARIQEICCTEGEPARVKKFAQEHFSWSRNSQGLREQL